MEATTRTNEAWLAQLRDSGAVQQAALAELRDALLRGLRRALSSRSRADDALLEDAAQDSLLRILDRLDQFEGRSRFLTWATSIAVRVAISELRRRRWKDVSLEELVADPDAAPQRAVDDSPPPDTQSERNAILDTMRALIVSSLTERQRMALMAELRGMPQDEISRHLGSSRNALYKLTHDARRRLKRELEAAGYTADDVQSAFAM